MQYTLLLLICYLFQVQLQAQLLQKLIATKTPQKQKTPHDCEAFQ
jgi:hypothetical protein